VFLGLLIVNTGNSYGFLRFPPDVSNTTAYSKGLLLRIGLRKYKIGYILPDRYKQKNDYRIGI
jgi:hypothetical protein